MRGLNNLEFVGYCNFSHPCWHTTLGSVVPGSRGSLEFPSLYDPSSDALQQRSDQILRGSQVISAVGLSVGREEGK